MKKITETFLAFIDPLFMGIPEDFSEDDIKGIFKVGYLTWNAVTLQKINDDEQFLKKIESSHEGEVLETFLMMIERKRGLFMDDERMLGQYNLEVSDDGKVDFEMGLMDSSVFSGKK